TKRGQTTVAVAVLIIAMLVFILIYILSLPPADREKLLNMTEKKEWNGNTEEFTIKIAEFSFDPDYIEVNQGDKVVITLKNKGKIPHNLVISEFNVETKTIEPDEEDTINFIADKKGQFTFYCSIEGHRNAGEFGELVVE
ncbi:hypothetical protein B6U80_00005, partial [Candidatus Pacearchaeota archaeon ex4484_26]